jgi:hypothetical protein
VDRSRDDVGLAGSIREITAKVASIPSVTGYVSLGAAVLLGRSIRQTLRTAARALDQVAANTVQVRANYRAVWRGVGSRQGDPARQGDVGDALVEAHFANESQWIIWLHEGAAAEWAGGAMQFDWTGLVEVARRASEEYQEETNGAARSIVRRAEEPVESRGREARVGGPEGQPGKIDRPNGEVSREPLDLAPGFGNTVQLDLGGEGDESDGDEAGGGGHIV